MNSGIPFPARPSRRKSRRLARLVWLLPFCLAGTATAMGLSLSPAASDCGAPAPARPAPPVAAQQRLPQSQATHGTRDIAWAWLGSPTRRYPHGALGSPVHAASLHVMASTPSGALAEVAYELPMRRVFEDRVPRLVDLDGDGRDEIIVVESDAFSGSALLVFGLRAGPQATPAMALTELARGPYTGSTFRWLNPLGVADFDGDGQLDLASVTTPHIGGVLTLHHFRPPQLQPYAKAMDVSNHRMGMLEQQLAVVVEEAGRRPTIIVPDSQLRALHALRWEAPGQWQEMGNPLPLPASVERLTPLRQGGCLRLDDATWWRVTLTPQV